MVAALSAEVVELRTALELQRLAAEVETEVATTSAPDPRNGGSHAWTTVAKRGKGAKKKWAKKPMTIATDAQRDSEPSTLPLTASSASQQALLESQKPQRQRWHSVRTLKNKQSSTDPARGQTATWPDENREVVTGVRRIWGTMKGCSCRVVLSTLQRCSAVSERVEVGRKFKKKGINEIRWWFLIRGEEDLHTLEQEWIDIETQTSWRLEHCYQPVTIPNDDSEVNASSPSTARNQSVDEDVSPFLLIE